ncbi:MAG: AMP-binding protein, partial [Tumebacillaceae bacterium]
MDLNQSQVSTRKTGTVMTASDGTLFHQVFEQQALRIPDEVAIVFGEQSLTYLELNLRANQLTHHLQARGVGPETLVGLCVE